MASSPLPQHGGSKLRKIIFTESSIPDPREALQVSRSMCDDPTVDEMIESPTLDADAALVHLRATPATAIRMGDRIMRHPPRTALACNLQDMRRGFGWRLDHPIDVISFVIPRPALDLWAKESGIQRFSGLVYRSGEDLCDDVIRNFALALLPSFERPERASRLFIDSVLQAVCNHLARKFGIARRREFRGGLAPWQERRAREMIKSGLSENIPLHQLAAECQLSVSHFVKSFRESVGMTPHQWLQRRRIDRAKEMIAAEDMPLAQIATSCGFADQSHFTRVFSASVGIPPGMWRRFHKSGDDMNAAPPRDFLVVRP